MVFLSPSMRILGWYLQVRPRPLPTTSFPIHNHSLIILSWTLYSLVTEKASLNKLPTYQPVFSLLKPGFLPGEVRFVA
jgi:hypothetical protein